MNNFTEIAENLEKSGFSSEQSRAIIKLVTDKDRQFFTQKEWTQAEKAMRSEITILKVERSAMEKSFKDSLEHVELRIKIYSWTIAGSLLGAIVALHSLKLL